MDDRIRDSDVQIDLTVDLKVDGLNKWNEVFAGYQKTLAEIIAGEFAVNRPMTFPVPAPAPRPPSILGYSVGADVRPPQIMSIGIEGRIPPRPDVPEVELSDGALKAMAAHLHKIEQAVNADRPVIDFSGGGRKVTAEIPWVMASPEPTLDGPDPSTALYDTIWKSPIKTVPDESGDSVLRAAFREHQATTQALQFHAEWFQAAAPPVMRHYDTVGLGGPLVWDFYDTVSQDFPAPPLLHNQVVVSLPSPPPAIFPLTDPATLGPAIGLKAAWDDHPAWSLETVLDEMAITWGATGNRHGAWYVAYGSQDGEVEMCDRQRVRDGQLANCYATFPARRFFPIALVGDAGLADWQVELSIRSAVLAGEVF